MYIEDLKIKLVATSKVCFNKFEVWYVKQIYSSTHVANFLVGCYTFNLNYRGRGSVKNKIIKNNLI